jgi:hypothetical protein
MELAKKGFTVVMVARSADKAETIKREIATSTGNTNADYIVGDLSRPGARGYTNSLKRDEKTSARRLAGHRTACTDSRRGGRPCIPATKRSSNGNALPPRSNRERGRAQVPPTAMDILRTVKTRCQLAVT